MSFLNIFKKDKEKGVEKKKITSGASKQLELKSDYSSGKGYCIQRICHSEKASRLNKENKYVFFVQPNATKQMIKQEVEARYKVKVENLNILNQQGKPKRWRTKPGKSKDIKKAIVTLKKGDKIEGV